MAAYMPPSQSDRWGTPFDLVASLAAEFDGFSLDPCADPDRLLPGIPDHFTEADDGLAQSWAGRRVFMNPPYSADAAWMRKAFEESRRGAFVVCLVYAKTDTAWWHEYAMRANEIRLVRGLLKFHAPGKDNGATKGSAIVIFHKDGYPLWPNLRVVSCDRLGQPLPLRLLEAA